MATHLEKIDGAMTKDPDRQSFWGHLAVLRAMVMRMALLVLAFAAMAFFFRKELFSVVLAPADSRFVTYRLFGFISGGAVDDAHWDMSLRLINTELAGQFMAHMQVAVYAGVLCASPYILCQLFRFVSPALYRHEREYAVKVAVSGYLMFLAGVLLSYFLIFPLTLRFLATYMVSSEVVNMLSLQSYLSSLLMMCVAMGIVFELPVLCWLLGRLGLITAAALRRCRRHAVVLILVAAAIITPTSDIVTLLLVSLPMFLLYEIGIRLVSSHAAEAT